MDKLPRIVLLIGRAQQRISTLEPVWLDMSYQINTVPEANIILSAPDVVVGDKAVWNDDLELCQIGYDVSILLMANQQEKVVFRGEIARRQIKVTCEAVSVTLKIRHSLQGLVNTHQSRIYENLSDRMIIEGMLQQYGVALTEMAPLNIVHEQLVQHAVSDWHFLLNRLHACGTWLFPSPSGVAVLPPKLLPIAQHSLVRRADNQQQGISERGDWYKNGQYQPAGLTLTGWDPHIQDANTVPAKVTSHGQGAFAEDATNIFNDVVWDYHFNSNGDIQEMTALADSLIMNLQSSATGGEFVVEGSVDYELGQTFSVNGYGNQLDGMGIITGVTQQISIDEGWKTILIIGGDSILSDYPIGQSIGGLQIGIVQPFTRDPADLNRFRIRLPVINDVEVWARFASPYASKNGGFCFYPEPGDEVVVGFFDGDPAAPVILGSLFSPVNKAPTQPDDQNNEKTIAFNTSQGLCQLEFNKASSAISLRTKESSLQLEKGISLNSDTSIDTVAKKTTIEGQDINISGKKTVAIKSVKINLSH